eukprot:TRINITY_DN33893_c0_g1_i1.p1 TRINITY_DN33893_c0_g1~~TRINITY_DN33893_c0_g1_i1.p1  ORF type:complete len:427 (-),score=36.11 TRINITY_DN33893_c0_g1_i1:141-1421(-)
MFCRQVRYIGFVTLSAFWPTSGVCVDDCNRRGYCSNATTCNCYGVLVDGLLEQQWTGVACEQRLCPRGLPWKAAERLGHCGRPVSECAGEGACDRGTGECQCNDLHAGRACAETTCVLDCRGRGACIHELSLQASSFVNRYRCDCEPGFIGPDCAHAVCPTNGLPTALGCNGAGMCDPRNGLCYCFEGHSGAACTSLQELVGPLGNASELTVEENVGYGFVRGSVASCPREFSPAEVVGLAEAPVFGENRTVWNSTLAAAIELLHDDCGHIAVHDPQFYLDGLYYMNVVLQGLDDAATNRCIAALKSVDTPTWNKAYSVAAWNLGLENVSLPTIQFHAWCRGVQCVLREGSGDPLALRTESPTPAPDADESAADLQNNSTSDSTTTTRRARSVVNDASRLARPAWFAGGAVAVIAVAVLQLQLVHV